LASPRQSFLFPQQAVYQPLLSEQLQASQVLQPLQLMRALQLLQASRGLQPLQLIQASQMLQALRGLQPLQLIQASQMLQPLKLMQALRRRQALQVDCHLMMALLTLKELASQQEPWEPMEPLRLP
jgi:hypothetical protein